MTAKRVKLSPCPVCGEPAAMDRQPDQYWAYCNGGSHFYSTEARKTEKEAAESWNKVARQAFNLRSEIILVFYDTSDGGIFEAFTTLETAQKDIAGYIKDHGGKKEWEQNNEVVWAHGGGRDFINIVELTVKDE